MTLHHSSQGCTVTGAVD